MTSSVSHPENDDVVKVTIWGFPLSWYGYTMCSMYEKRGRRRSLQLGCTKKAPWPGFRSRKTTANKSGQRILMGILKGSAYDDSNQQLDLTKVMAC